MDLIECLIPQNHDEIMINCLWAIAYFADGGDDHIERILQMNKMSIIIDLLSSNNSKMQAAAIRCVGNLVCGESKVIRKMIKEGLLDALAITLNHSVKTIRKETCWTLSNILTETSDIIEEIFVHENQFILKKLFELAREDQPDVLFYIF